VRQDVVIAERGHDGDVQVDKTAPVGVEGFGTASAAAAAAVAGKNLDEAIGDPLVRAKDLVGAAGQALVAVVAGAVAGPDDKVDLVTEVGGDPVEGGVDQPNGAVAFGRGGAVPAGLALAAVTGAIAVGGRVRLVELVRVDV
jgi:hypothetical protein